jgi:hypothetical protein
MKSIIITLIVFGILGYFAFQYSKDFDELLNQNKKKDNHTRVLSEPFFIEKSSNANIVLMNDNEFDISSPVLVCNILNAGGEPIKAFKKMFPDIKIAKKGSTKIGNIQFGQAEQYPKKIVCEIESFKGEE